MVMLSVLGIYRHGGFIYRVGAGSTAYTFGDWGVECAVLVEAKELIAIIRKVSRSESIGAVCNNSATCKFGADGDVFAVCDDYRLGGYILFAF